MFIRARVGVMTDFVLVIYNDLFQILFSSIMTSSFAWNQILIVVSFTSGTGFLTVDPSLLVPTYHLLFPFIL